MDKGCVRKLTDDALKGADKDIDFSRYFFVVIFLGAKLMEYGLIGLCGYPGMSGWSSEDIIKTPGGQTVRWDMPPPGISSWSKLSSAGLPMTG